MKLYYHMTDGGAEYYSTTHVPGSNEGSLEDAIIRTDGGEIEVFADRIRSQGLKLVIKGDYMTKENGEEIAK